jgi:hypothetical protein
MEKNAKIQYELRNGQTVYLNADMSLPYLTIERAVMSFYGFKEEAGDERGVAIWCDIKSGQRRYVSLRDIALIPEGADVEAFLQSYELPIIDMLHNASVAQDLIKDVGLHITPIAFRNGSLEGVWRVERVSSYNPWDVVSNGIITGMNQPVATESPNLLHAIYATACRVMGLGKIAFITFPAGAEGEEKIIATDFELVNQLNDMIGISVFRSEMLDRYITSQIPDEVKIEAVAIARAQCRAVLPGSDIAAG